MNRRGFIGSIIVACAAPAIVRAEVLMPVRPVVISNRIVTMEEIAREALRIWSKNRQLKSVAAANYHLDGYSVLVQIPKPLYKLALTN